MQEITYQIHWLSFTVHAPREDAFKIYKALFRDTFGDLEDTGHGGRSFKDLYQSLLGFKIYLTPSNPDKHYFNFEIPGQACEQIHWTYFQALEELLEGNYKENYSYKRADFAFDHIFFTPYQVMQALMDEQVRTLAKRDSISDHGSPFALRDDGKEATYSVYLGSNSSQRMIRVYNKRGPTRLEFQTRHERAHLITKEVLTSPSVEDWFPIMIAHLRDYVDFETKWWEEFTNGIGRARAIISTPKELSSEKLLHWFDHQVSPAWSVLVDTQSDDLIKTILNRGRERRGSRYNLLLEDAKPNLDNSEF